MERASGEEEARHNGAGQPPVAAVAAAATDNDEEQENEATNCSETMSTTANEEAEEEEEDEETVTQATSRRPRSRASVAERLGTPRHWPPPPPPTTSACDEEQQQQQGVSSDYYRHQVTAADTGILQRSPDEPATATMSELTSATETDGGGCHAPPSYGTATRPDTNCTSLDATQLQLMQQQQRHLIAASRYYPTAATMTMNGGGAHYGGVHISGTGSNQQANAAERLQQQPLFAKTIGAAVRLDGRLASQQQQQQQQGLHQYFSGAPHLAYLSSGSLPRARFMAHLNGVAANDLRQPQPKQQQQQQHRINSVRPDNNQAATMLHQVSYAAQQHQHQQQQLQQQLQMRAGGGGQPINHVISATGSSQTLAPSGRPQLAANQYYVGGGGGQQPTSMELFGSAVAASSSPGFSLGGFGAAGQSSLVGLAHSHSQGSLAVAAAAAASAKRNEALASLARPVAISGGAPSATNPLGAPASQFQSQSQAQANSNNNQRAPLAANQAPPLQPQQQPQESALGAFQQHQQQQPLRRDPLPQVAALAEQARFSRRQQQQQQQQQQAPVRKRRRHRSTSGRSVSPESGPGKRRGQQQQQHAHTLQHPGANASGRSLSATRSQAQQAQISAHCWLIDSSDDQTYAPTTTKQSNGPQQQQHLTVAMMRQSAQQQRQLRAGQSTCPPTSASQQQQQLVYRDLTTDLRTNSLRMERILNKSEEQGGHKLQPMKQQQRQAEPASRRRRLSSASSDETSCGLAAASRASQVEGGDHSGTVLRLSALLSLISNLVKRPKSSKGSSGESHSAAVSSVSGSMQHNTQAGAPYALAISSSSSTSAYATESSHPSSGGSRTVASIPSVSAAHEPAILLSQFKLGGGGGAAPPSTAGSSLFYSSSGVSGLTQPSSHGYEYCDQDAVAVAQTNAETRFVASPQPTPPAAGVTTTMGARSPDSSASSTQAAKSSQSSTDGDAAGEASNHAMRRQHMMIMSDNDLISASSEAGFPAPTTAAAVVHMRPHQLGAIAPGARQVGAAIGGGNPARCRWQWLSLKDWLRGPCKTTSGSDSECGAGLAGLAASARDNDTTAARYKALRSRRRQQGGSTLQNVLSLAKADRVFRVRLLACLLVSCVLIGLICSLVGLLYARSSQRNKLSMFIDDSDYDLSWLWPPKQPSPFEKPEFVNNLAQTSDQQLPPPPLPPPPNLASDNNLRAQLLLVERSERLNQFQLTMAHLINLQLIGNNFIDITQLAKHLAPPPTPPPQEPTVAAVDLNSNSNGSINPSSMAMIQLNELDHDLVSLSLLSNLHWPLIKWKHQSQQAVANFLSFALPMPTVPLNNGGARGGNGLQTFRNLLSALLLAEWQSTSPHPPPLPSTMSNNLNQFNRLNTLLRSISYNLISCSYSLNTAMIRQLPLVKIKFCRQLIARYRRMMSNLAVLDQSKLMRLHRQIDLGLDLSGPLTRARTLPSFFLDQLALLDPQSLAAATLANDDSTSGGEEFNQAIRAILRPDAIWVAREADEKNRWQPKNSLFELAKIVIGNQIEQQHEKLEPLIKDSGGAMNEELQLAQDLFYPWTSSRLPQFVAPLAYDLFLHPNLTTRFVLGMVKIEFQLERAVNFVVMNCHRLNLVDLSVWIKQQPQPIQPINQTSTTSTIPGALKQLPIRRVLTSKKMEQIYIELEDRLEPWTVQGSLPNHHQPVVDPTLSFSGELPLKDVSRRRNLFVINISFNKTSLIGGTREPGLEILQYADYYAQPEAEIKTMLYSQFEPTNARRLFPCFDEPQFKAKFQLNMVHDQQHQVLFNAMKRERIPYTSDGQHQMSVFEPTLVPLSTYLVSFVVYDSQNIKSIASRANQLQTPGFRQPALPVMKHIQVQVLAQFELLSQAEFASQLVPQLLHFYQTLLQFAYPMDKLDLLALPLTSLTPPQQQEPTAMSSPQAIETMENMGLIWFKANLLMVDPNLISQNLIEQVALVISHQLAHQYFGNIVGIRSWQDLWLYESLCQYLESIALSHVQADWNLGEQFPVTTIQETLALEQFSPDPQTTPAQLLLMTNENVPEPGATDLREQPSVAAAAASLVADGSAGLLETVANSQGPGGLQLPENLAQLQVAQDGEFEAVTEQRFSYDLLKASIGGGSPIEPKELKRSSAVLHMFLFNLLPNQEAQIRLLRRCLNLFKYQTMSRHQYWEQFRELLMQEGSLNPLAPLDLTAPLMALTQPYASPPQGDIFRTDSTISTEEHLAPNSSTTNQQSERVVFVRNIGDTARPAKQDEGGDVHRIKVRSMRPAGDAWWQHYNKLELAANIWLDKSVGFPLVTASVYRDRIHLRQERFSFGQPGEDGSMLDLGSQDGKRAKRQDTVDNLIVWPIPLMFVSRLNQKSPRFFWLDKREMEIPYNDGPHQLSDYLPFKGPLSSWFKLNVNQSSLVRVNYDDRNWEALTELLVKSHYSNHPLGPLDRANLLDDALTLMRSGKLSVGLAMNLTLYLEVGERDYMPWTSALRHLDQMQTLLNQNPLWHRYVLKLMRPISSVIGWKDDGPHLMRKLRRTLFNVALQYGDEKTISKAKQEFKGWLKNSRYIVPNLQELVYVAGVRYGDQQEWFHCWQKYQQLVSMDSTLNQSSIALWAANHTINEALHGIRGRQAGTGPAGPVLVGVGELVEPNAENEKRQLLTALASTQNTWLLEQFLNYSMDSTKIQSHYLKHVMQTLGKNPVARLYLWRFVRLNWNSLLDRFMNLNSKTGGRPAVASSSQQDNLQILETLIVESTKHFATKLDYEEVKTFFDSKRKQLEEHFNLDDASGIAVVQFLERAIQQSLQIIRSNVYWRDHIEPKLTKWLSQYDGATIS